jgi:membrane protease YdiL (CAAX protease family)
MAARGDIDRRVPVALVVAAGVLTMLEYYGGRSTYGTLILPALQRRVAAGDLGWMHLETFEELYGFVYWTLSHITGYVVIPLTVWRVMFREDSVLDLGLRTRGFFKHLWVYGLCIAVVMPCLFIVSREPDFGTYYPFYTNAGRSWFDLVAWELIYGAQFFALEMFFRGWLLGALRRSLGSGAIFAMAAPYCMIHFGKPYLEAFGAIVAGVVLGSLSMRTKSIYAGFLVHVTVAVSMDLVALSHRDALPIELVPW